MMGNYDRIFEGFVAVVLTIGIGIGAGIALLCVYVIPWLWRHIDINWVQP